MCLPTPQGRAGGDHSITIDGAYERQALDSAGQQLDATTQSDRQPARFASRTTSLHQPMCRRRIAYCGDAADWSPTVCTIKSSCRPGAAATSTRACLRGRDHAFRISIRRHSRSPAGRPIYGLWISAPVGLWISVFYCLSFVDKRDFSYPRHQTEGLWGNEAFEPGAAPSRCRGRRSSP